MWWNCIVGFRIWFENLDLLSFFLFLCLDRTIGFYFIVILHCIALQLKALLSVLRLNLFPIPHQQIGFLLKISSSSGCFLLLLLLSSSLQYAKDCMIWFWFSFFSIPFHVLSMYKCRILLSNVLVQCTIVHMCIIYTCLHSISGQAFWTHFHFTFKWHMTVQLGCLELFAQT